MGAGRETAFFDSYLEARKGKTTCHPCAYGVFCACAGIRREEALAGFLYAQASAMVTNCVKTIPLSQSDGQKLLLSLHPRMEELVREAETAGEEMLCALHTRVSTFAASSTKPSIHGFICREGEIEKT